MVSILERVDCLREFSGRELEIIMVFNAEWRREVGSSEATLVRYFKDSV